MLSNVEMLNEVNRLNLEFTEAKAVKSLSKALDVIPESSANYAEMREALMHFNKFELRDMYAFADLIATGKIDFGEEEDRWARYTNEALKKLAARWKVPARAKVVLAQKPVDLNGDPEIGENEAALDAFFFEGKDLRLNLHPTRVKDSAEWARAQAARLYLAYDSKDSDAQYAEAYAKIDKRRILRAVTVLNDYADNLEASKVTVARKTSVAVGKNPAKVVRDMKYAKSDDALKLTSINPTAIVGAKEVWIYNTKNRTLSRVVANPGESLTVSGTTLKNVSMTVSRSRNVRKPETLAAAITPKNTKASLEKYYSRLSDKEKALEMCRMTENTIILYAA